MHTSEPQRISVIPLNISGSISINQLFEQFSNNEWAMVLDSANSQHPNGRYDIMVANPIATIVTHQNHSLIWHQNSGKTTESQDNPLALIQQVMTQYLPVLNSNNHDELPFKLGAMGFFGYDLGRQFEPLPIKVKDEYQAPDMAIGIYAWSIIKDNQTQKFYLSSLTPYPHPDIENLCQIAKQEKCSTFKLTSDWTANMSQGEYQQKISHVHEYLRAGDCYQINLAQRFSASYQGSEWQAYKKLTKANQAPFSSFIRLSNCTILSISPERFLSVKNNKVETKPIKGTSPRNENPVQDAQNIKVLLSSDKDRAENLMIVDLLRNDLSKHCQPGSVKVPELFKIESFNAVHHLVSTVTGELKSNSSALDLFQGAFPGGSITGAPKIRAMEIIDQLEPNNRNVYCGSIGYIGILGDMDTSICIRTLLCEQKENENNIYCWAGGGIVIDSQAELEYQESLDKVSKILPILKTADKNG